MGEVFDIDTAYEELINAIILRAVEDYKNILTGSVREHKGCNMKELMMFFNGNWFASMCSIDTEAIMDQLRRLMKKMMLTHDVVKERGGSKYWVVMADCHDCRLEGPFDNKKKALHRAAEMQDLSYEDYMKIRRKEYRNAESE